RVEGVQRGGIRAAAAAGAAAGPGEVAAIAPGGVVQVGGGPAAGAGDAVAVLLLAGELQSRAQVGLDAAGGEIRAQVELVGRDSVALVLEGGVAAGHGGRRQVAGIGPVDVAGRVAVAVDAAGRHERRQQVVLLGLAPAQGV